MSSSQPLAGSEIAEEEPYEWAYDNAHNVAQDNGKEQPGEKVRPVRMQLPMHVPGLSASVLFIANQPTS